MRMKLSIAYAARVIKNTTQCCPNRCLEGFGVYVPKTAPYARMDQQNMIDLPCRCWAGLMLAKSGSMDVLPPSHAAPLDEHTLTALTSTSPRTESALSASTAAMQMGGKPDSSRSSTTADCAAGLHESQMHHRYSYIWC